MNTFIFNVIFLLISLYILFKAIGYGIYEINEKENKSGGISVIAFSIIVVISSNIMMLIR